MVKKLLEFENVFKKVRPKGFLILSQNGKIS